MPASNEFAPVVESLADFNRFVHCRLSPLVDLAFRFWLAQFFFRAGFLNTVDPEPTIWLFTFVVPIPGVAAETATQILTGIELLAPVFLATGFLTRLSALLLLPGGWILYTAYPAAEVHVFVLALLGVAIIYGPGAISLDCKFRPAQESSTRPLARLSRLLGRFLVGNVAPVYLLLLRISLALVFGVSGWLLVHNTAPEYLMGLPRFGFALPGTTGMGDMVSSSSVSLLASGLILPAAILLGVGLAVRVTAVILTAHLVLFSLPGGGAPHYLPACLLLAVVALDRRGIMSMDQLVRKSLFRAFPSLSPDADWLVGAPHVVIIGGGFGGIAAALGLRHARANVTLIDRRNYHLFQPLLYQVATASLSPADIATPIRSLTRGIGNCRVVMGRVGDVNTETREVLIEDGRRVAYDHLVLATGAKHSYFGKDEWEAFAPGLKKIDDATAIRRDILLAFEKAENETDDAERARLMHFVIVGGGPTGVELAGAIAELARQGLNGEFTAIDPAQAQIILVQSAPRLLPAMPEKLSEKARVALELLGVDVRTGSRVDEIDARGVTVGGKRIEAGTVIWAAGVAASPAGRWVDGERDRAGRVIVDGELRVARHDNIYAIGDTASCDAGGTGPLPGLAAVAKQQGQYVAKQLRARIENRPLPGLFRYRDYGSMATIGREKAVADLRGLQLSGLPAWWLWCGVHVAFMADARNRLSVIIDWAWSYLTFSRRIRLITGNPAIESDG